MSEVSVRSEPIIATNVWGRPPSGLQPQAKRNLALLCSLGSVSLLAWAWVLMTIGPHRLLTFAAFLCPLWICIGSFIAAGLYWTRVRVDETGMCLIDSLRQGSIIAAAAVVLLAVLAAHKLSLISLVIILVCAAGLEVVGRIRQSRSEGADAGAGAARV